MKAAVYTKTKTGKTLEIKDVDQPVPKSNEVLIRVRAASVNPLDWRLKSHRPGVDVAGEVAAAGENVTRFKVADAVFGTCKGAFAEYACTSSAELVAKPEHLTYEEAACLPIAGLTALQGLRDKARLRTGQRVLINGAAGGVGTFAVQIARSLGAEVTAVTSTGNVEMVRSLGAAEVIDYRQEDFTLIDRKHEAILDNVGNRTFASLRRVMAPRARCVLAGMPKEMGAVTWRLLRALTWPPFLEQKFRFFVAKMNVDDLATLCDLAKRGELKPMIAASYTLSEMAEAIGLVEGGHAAAKVVITVP